MVDRWLVDVVVSIHVLFVVFVAIGGLLAARWRALASLHAPAAVWATAIVPLGFTCPLTALEKLLRRRAGYNVYDGGFVDHYFGPLTTDVQILVALMVIAPYLMFRLRRTGRHGSGCGQSTET